MIVVARKGRVPAPVEEVWALVRQAESLPSWLAGLRRVRVLGPEGFGQLLYLTGSRTGDGLDRQAEIIAWKPPTLLAWRCVGERGATPDAWGEARPDELHIQLGPAPGGGTQVLLYAVCPAGPLAGLRLRLGPARRWRQELGRSMAALVEMFATPAVGAN